MPAAGTRKPPHRAGLPELRRRGAVTELLFLYECTTAEAAHLRPIADRLGLTVQAASHIFRQLQQRGLAEVREGRYRPTVPGVAWLHSALGLLREDVSGRLARLDVVRSTRAIARTDLDAGQRVTLELHDGLLTARSGGAGASRGRVRTAVRQGELVEVDRLEGIVPIARGRVSVAVVPTARLNDPAVRTALARRVKARTPGLLGALGLEAFHVLRKVTDREVVRYAVASAVREASDVGVESLVVVLDEELPRLLEQFGGRNAPVPEVTTLP